MKGREAEIHGNHGGKTGEGEEVREKGE